MRRMTTKLRKGALAWISTVGNFSNTGAVSAALSHTVSRSGTPLHQGTRTGVLSSPEATTMGRWARR